MKKQILFSFFVFIPVSTKTLMLEDKFVQEQLFSGVLAAGLLKLAHYYLQDLQIEKAQLELCVMEEQQKKNKELIDYQEEKNKESLKQFAQYKNQEQEEAIIETPKKVSWYGPLPEAAQRIIQFAQNFDKLKAAGLDKSPNVLLEGPPGTGKSHLARYIAQELGVAYFEKNSGEFHDKYIGVGPQAMKQLFADAAQAAQKSGKKSIGAVIFIDEIEGIGGQRDNNGGSTSAEETRLINTLFSEMTKPENEHVLVICATNLAHKLDNALIRPGRFGLHAHIGCPTVENRVELFKNFLNNAYKAGQEFKNNQPFTGKTPYSQALFEKAAELTENFVTADIKEVVERALLAAVEKEGKDTASESLLLTAIDELRQQKDTIAKARIAHDPVAQLNAALAQAA